MTNNKTHTVFIEKDYDTDIETIFNLFKNATVLKLTGADDIQSDFVTDGHFCLTFNGRGTIHGRFINITHQDIVIEWNVDGFERPDEIKTIVEIALRKENEKCILTLHHKNIKNGEAAVAKQKAWTQILNEIEKSVSLK